MGEHRRGCEAVARRPQRRLGVVRACGAQKERSKRTLGCTHIRLNEMCRPTCGRDVKLLSECLVTGSWPPFRTSEPERRPLICCTEASNRWKVTCKTFLTCR